MKTVSKAKLENIRYLQFKKWYDDKYGMTIQRMMGVTYEHFMYNEWQKEYPLISKLRKQGFYKKILIILTHTVGKIRKNFIESYISAI